MKDIRMITETSEEETVESPAGQEAEDSVAQYGTVVNASFVSVHERASDTAQVNDYVRAGDKVEILGFTSGFYMVRFGRSGRLGFISHNFVRRD